MSGQVNLASGPKPANSASAPAASSAKKPPSPLALSPDEISSASPCCGCCKSFFAFLGSLLSSLWQSTKGCFSSIKNWISPSSDPDSDRPRPTTSWKPTPKPLAQEPREEPYRPYYGPEPVYVEHLEEKKARPPVRPPSPILPAARPSEPPKPAVSAATPFTIPAPCCPVKLDLDGRYKWIKERLAALPDEIKAKIVFHDDSQSIDFHFTRSTLETLCKTYPPIRTLFGEPRMPGVTLPAYPPALQPLATTRLIQQADRYYDRLPACMRCPVDFDRVRISSGQELLEDILQTGHGVLFLDFHDNSSPKYVPYFHMALLKRCGVETLFVEAIPYELKSFLDAFHEAPPGSKLPPVLEAWLDGVVESQEGMRKKEAGAHAKKAGALAAAPGKQGNIVTLQSLNAASAAPAQPQLKKEASRSADYYTLKDMVIAAQKNGIRVVGLDSEPAMMVYKDGNSDAAIFEWMLPRLKTMNFQAIQIIQMEKRAGKYAVHTGALHGTEQFGVRSIAQALGLPTLFAMDRKKPQDKVGIYRKKLFEERDPVKGYVLAFTPDFTIIMDEPRKH